MKDLSKMTIEEVRNEIAETIQQMNKIIKELESLKTPFVSLQHEKLHYIYSLLNEKLKLLNLLELELEISKPEFCSLKN